MTVVVIDASEARGSQLRGWGRYVDELAGAIARRPGGDDLDVQAVAGGAGRLPEVAWEQVGLPRALARRGAALVHAPNCFLPLRRGCPGVVTVHDLAFEAFPGDFSRRTGAKYRFFTPRAARSAERVITDSAFTADDLCARYGVDRERIRVIALAPSLPIGATPPVGGSGPFVLGVGDLRPKKNWARVAQAMRALRETEGTEHRLVIAGVDAGEGERIRAAAGDVPVELPGYVDDDRLDALMRGADLLVHPSLYEGFGLVVVEAMARGCPVVAADATSLPEAAGGAAELFDPLSPDAIAQAIHAVLAGRDRRDELVAAGRLRVASLSWERTAAATLEVYREALAA
jgi:glycosyltransferase involved in cell wall biosynthesis